MKKKLLNVLFVMLFCTISPTVWSQTKIASWNFNNTYTTATNIAGDSTFYTPTTTASSATVSMSNSKFRVYPDTIVSGTTLQNYGYNAVSTVMSIGTGYQNMVSKLQFAGPNAINVYTDGASQKNYFQFIFPTKGYENINVSFSFATGQSTTADYVRMVYSTDGGTTWLDAGVNYAGQSGWWLYKTYSQTIGARNKDQVIVRLLPITALTSSTANFTIDFLRVYGTAYTPISTPIRKLNAIVSPSSAAGGFIISPIGNEFYEGTNVTVTNSTRTFGYIFKEWQDSKGTKLSNASAITLKLMTDSTIVAVYNQVNTHNFKLNLNGSSWGKVSLSPAPTNGKYEAGTTVTMTVTPNKVTNFCFWDDRTTALSRTLVITKDTTVSATFDDIPFIAGWDFKTDVPKSNRSGDYYSSATNKGIFNMLDKDKKVVGWLSNTGAFSPSLPCAYVWTTGANFLTDRRYFQAKFSTKDYYNIQVKSQMAGNYQHYLTQKMQASLDSLNWTDLNSLNISTTTWADLNATLPATFENQTKIYVRWAADATSTLVGKSTDADGTAITNVFIYADKVVPGDVTPPTATATLPTEGATDATVSGSIVVTFNERVKAGTGNITLGGKNLTGTYGNVMVTFAYNKLSYNTDYTFTIPAGAIIDMAGNAYPGLTLHFHTMNRPTPAPKMFDAVVAKDGSGNYTSIQTAIDAAPAGRAIPWLIYVKNGKYKGHVDIPSTKPFINLIGQNRDSVIITDARLCGKSTVFPDSAVYAVDPGATVVVKSSDCYFENICFENQFGYETVSGPQALALYTLNDRIILNNCWLRSFQDTYLTAYNSATARHYVKNCRIEGAVDFIYGSGNVFFDQCLIYCTRSSGGYIVAPGHISGTPWGYVFDRCTIDGPSTSYTTYLGRPWTNSPMTSFFNTTFKIGIYPEGWWYKMGAIPAIFADYKSVDASGNLVDLSQRISQYQYDVKDANGIVTNTMTGTAKKSFTDAEAATYTYENVTSGTDSWDPKSQIIPTTAPANLKKVSGGLTWDATPYAICYVVEKNGKIIGFPTTNAYTDASYSSTAIYKVTAVSEFGALSPSTVATNGTTTDNIVQNQDKVYAYTTHRTLVVKNVTPGSQVSAYSFAGTLISRKTAASTAVTFDFVSPCILKVVNGTSSTILKVIK